LRLVGLLFWWGNDKGFAFSEHPDLYNWLDVSAELPSETQVPRKELPKGLAVMEQTARACLDPLPFASISQKRAKRHSPRPAQSIRNCFVRLST
jgi:hypothetical protein